ncbi:hypothetical protein K0M31_004474 [Melipona bicolor]|uniref:Uncharacterized protein n=1 Tax=Melipona bicolor TaxID=60889 RepID=A0AA40FWV5_9HYME|nr:hypothetical protein K0M31_004474 [Melipona bicolor]
MIAIGSSGIEPIPTLRSLVLVNKVEPRPEEELCILESSSSSSHQPSMHLRGARVHDALCGMELARRQARDFAR